MIILTIFLKWLTDFSQVPFIFMLGGVMTDPEAILMHNLSLAETDCETKEVRGFSRPANDGFKVLL